MDSASLVALVAAAMTHDADRALTELMAADPDPYDDTVLAARAFLEVLTCRFDQALDTAHVLAERPALSPLATAASDLAVAVCAGTVAEVRRLEELDGPLSELTAMLRVEAAMSSGWISTAAEQAALIVGEGPIQTPAGAWSAIALARARAFEGRFADADELVSRVLSAPVIGDWPQLHVLARGARIFVDGHLGRPDAVVAGMAELRRTDLAGADHDYILAGAGVMAAFGLHVIGRLDDAVEAVLTSGGGSYLTRLQIVDRLFGYEILLDEALHRGDLTAARIWVERGDGLPVHEHVMAAAILSRIHARMSIAMAETDVGIQESADAGVLAAIVGSDLEVIRARIIESSARATSSDRIRGIDELEDAARRAGAAGAAAVKEWAERELRQHGRRLRNAPGVGWDALTQTQQRVARLAAAGLRNREIGAALWISDKTVESHVAAILSALGTTNRVGIGRELGGDAASPGLDHLLTGRQREVARLVARGLMNAEISSLLGISEKTVEKHVSGLFDRLNVRTRSAIAARVRGAGTAAAESAEIGPLGSEA